MKTKRGASSGLYFLPFVLCSPTCVIFNLLLPSLLSPLHVHHKIEALFFADVNVIKLKICSTLGRLYEDGMDKGNETPDVLLLKLIFNLFKDIIVITDPMKSAALAKMCNF